MKTFSLFTAFITGTLLLSTLLCGLWIHFNKLTDAEAVRFHVKLGTATVVFGILTVALLISVILKRY